MKDKTALIIGGGPAGLTAAYELLQRTDIRPIVLEALDQVGGIARTVNYKGNRIDIGGHRFFSKSDRVTDWWLQILPLQGAPAKDDLLLKRSLPLSEKPDAPDPEKEDLVMLHRGRLSRIFYLRKFFDYPISLSWQTISGLGIVRICKIGISYLYACAFPRKPEHSLEDFLINRFGRHLYETFFKDYTHKVWGVPCTEIKPEWGAQRIKGLSIKKTLLHLLKKPFASKDIAQKTIETSLIGQFLYPKFGPGQMWETVAQQIIQKGGEVKLGQRVSSLKLEDARITSLTATDQQGHETSFTPDYVFSTMSLQELIAQTKGTIPPNVQEVAKGLAYRDFITVGLLCEKLQVQNQRAHPSLNNIIPDNWLYIQEPDVKLGRLQVFNNWSPYMVKNPDHTWIGLEYFANEGDELWEKPDKVLVDFAIQELQQIGLLDPSDVLDSTIIRQPKAYPAYFGSYDRLGELKDFLNTIDNLFVLGRNGTHRYNNQDHSMLSAMTAVDNIVAGIKNKENIWQVNAEETYHETKS